VTARIFEGNLTGLPLVFVDFEALRADSLRYDLGTQLAVETLGSCRRRLALSGRSVPDLLNETC